MSKSELEEIWEKKSDAELMKALEDIGGFTDAGRKVILAEIERRQNKGQVQGAVGAVELDSVKIKIDNYAKRIDGSAVINRYNDAYIVANALKLIGSIIEFAGIVIGGLVAFAGIRLV